MTTTRTVDNSERPAQPEPGEDPATQAPSVREESGDDPAVDRAIDEERKRQTGE